MKRIYSAAIAGMVANAALVSLATPAAADGWAAGAFVGGTVLGLALGTSLASPPPPPPAYYYAPPVVYYAPPPAYRHYAYADHVAWCRVQYPGYDPHTDTFLGADGIVYRCVGPY